MEIVKEWAKKKERARWLRKQVRKFSPAQVVKAVATEVEQAKKGVEASL